MLVQGLEGLMSRPRAADDFKTIRTRMEELQREKLPGQPTPATDTSVAGHRGPCAAVRPFADFESGPAEPRLMEATLSTPVGNPSEADIHNPS
jgi:hypothetical protein